MDVYIKVSGVWKRLDPSTKVGGAWKAVQNGYVKVAGVWKEFYSAITVVWNPTSHTLSSIDSGATTCGIIFRNDGTVDHDDNGSISQVGTWHKDAPLAGLGDDFEITAQSGGSGSWTVAAAADNTPIALTSDRTWSVTEVTPGQTEVASRTFLIGEVGNPSNAASAINECTAERL